MLEKIKNFLIEENIRNKKIITGYSTGADSTSLLYSINSLKNEFNLEVAALHINHGWREESAEEEEFAKNFCEKLGVEFYCEKLDASVQKTETSARDKRYEIFEKYKNKLNADYVFLAHNREDNIETLIYRIIKGTGLDGLRSIPSKRDFYMRPLLNISRAEIEEYIKNNNLEIREDSSNSDTKYNRNFIRHKILPLMKEINPTCVDSMANLIEVTKNGYEIIEDKLKEVKQKIYDGDKIISSEFKKLKRPYKIEIIENLIKDDLKNPNLKKIEDVVSFIDNTLNEEQDPQYRKWKKFSVNSELFLYVNKKEIYKGK